jgi:hypothetical protein
MVSLLQGENPRGSYTFSPPRALEHPSMSGVTERPRFQSSRGGLVEEGHPPLPPGVAGHVGEEELGALPDLASLAQVHSYPDLLRGLLPPVLHRDGQSSPPAMPRPYSCRDSSNGRRRLGGEAFLSGSCRASSMAPPMLCGSPRVDSPRSALPGRAVRWTARGCCPDTIVDTLGACSTSFMPSRPGR